MPALNPCPPDAAAPGRTRRRVWAHPDLRSHSLLVLTPDGLHLAPLAGPPRPETVAAVEAGADLDDCLGPLATVVPLASVRRVRLDLLSNSVAAEYAGGRPGTGRVVAVFATPEAADACFTKTWRRLGDGCELLPYKREAWALVRVPLAFLATILIGTALLAVLLSVFENFAEARSAGATSVTVAGELGTPGPGSKSRLEALVGWMNWRVVCGVGGAAAAAVQVWMYRRLTQPPLSLEVVRAEGSVLPGSEARTPRRYYGPARGD